LVTTGGPSVTPTCTSSAIVTIRWNEGRGDTPSALQNSPRLLSSSVCAAHIWTGNGWPTMVFWR
jgi:hypothetical protein